MGSVWRATHLALHAPCAIKLIDPNIVDNPEALARFVREARAAAGLRSPHVVQILDHGIDDATHAPFIAMELLEGQSLGDRLQRSGRLTPAETARIVTQVARALNRAHEAGIVHRDLKPDNIFIVSNEDEELAKVLDFGIAKSHRELGIDAATRTGAVMGTPYYMSPEQISGAKDLDYRTDLWALGVIACECMTGFRPFESDSVGGLTLKICVEPPPVPSRLAAVPAGFDQWFARATARVPGDRFQSARELAEDLRRVAEHADVRMVGTVQGTSTPPPAHWSQPSPPRTMGPVSRTTGSGALSAAPEGARLGTVLALAAAVLVLVGLGTFATIRFGRSQGGERELASTAPPVATIPSAILVPPAVTATAPVATARTAEPTTAPPPQVTPAELTPVQATKTPDAPPKTKKSSSSKKAAPAREPVKEAARPTRPTTPPPTSPNLGVLDERR
jgi:serine/threonine-protein kinase